MTLLNDYSTLFYHNPFPTWVYEISTFKILDVNQAAIDHYGYSRDEFLSMTLKELRPPGEIPKLVHAHSDIQSKEGNIYFGVFTHQKKSGDLIRMEINGHKVMFQGCDCVMVICRDVTQSDLEEERKTLVSKVSSVFNEEGSLKEVMNRLVRVISDYASFSISEIWLPTTDQTRLKLYSSYGSDASGKKFYEVSKDVQYIDVGVGLPGRVWQSKKHVIWDKNQITDLFYRFEQAIEANLNSVYGLPIKYKSEVIGVLVVGSTQPLRWMKKHHPVLNRLESIIGSELHRKVIESDLSQLFETLPDLICLADFNGVFLKMNQAGCDLLGYKENEIVGSKFDKFVHPDDDDISKNELEKLLTGQTVFRFENRYIRKSGDVIWLSWHCKSMVDEGAIYATAKDITHEKKLTELLSDAAKMARIGGWEVDLVKNKIHWSAMVHEIYETNPDTYTPDLNSSINFYREDFRDLVANAVQESIDTGKSFDFEAPLVTAKGNETWVRAIGNTEFVEKSCVRIFGSFQDIDVRKKAELQLIATSQQLEEILGSISDAFYAVDKNWNFTYFNKEAERLLKRKKEEVLGKSIWVEFSPAKGTELETIYRRVAKSGEPETFEYYYPGDDSWYEINTYPSKGGISSYFKNITERRRAAEELQKAYNEKNMILESIGEAFFTMDKNFVVSYWNHKAEEIIGVNRNKLIGKSLWDVFPDAIALPSYKNYHTVLKTGEPIEFEDYYGTWLEVRAYPFDDGLTVFFRDISAQKDFNQRIMEANERFEKVAEATTDAIWDWDIKKGTYYRGNGFQDLFGYDVYRFLNSEDFWSDSFHPEDLDGLKESIELALKSTGSNYWQKEYRIIHTSGAVKTVVDKGVIIRNEVGEAVRMVGAITDITDRIKYENELKSLNNLLSEKIRELELSNEQLEQFAFIASHDLQEPLRMISSFLNQLERKYGNNMDEKAMQYIHFATDGAKRMKQIILDLLEYSRASNNADLPLESIDLNAVLDEYQILRRRLIQEKRVAIEYEKLPTITGMKAPLVQTIHSLIDNGIKYSKTDVDPRIDLHIKDLGDMFQISVSDNGIGIDPEFHEKIFVIFQRLHNRENYTGNGIGLSIAKKHVESWGGKIWVDSELGKGSTFHFTISKIMS